MRMCLGCIESEHRSAERRDSQQLIPTEAEGLTPASVRSALDDENGRLTELEAHLKSVKDGSARSSPS